VHRRPGERGAGGRAQELSSKGFSFAPLGAVWEHRGVPETADLIAAIDCALREEERVAAAYVFGSVARGEDTALSDVDVALVVTARSEMERALIVREAGLRLGRAVPGRSFDVHVLDELPVAIAGRVVAEGKLVFERDAAARVRAVVAARMAYHDFAWLERATLDEGLRGLRERLDRG
jgi:predicted nucleotidyltransferase